MIDFTINNGNLIAFLEKCACNGTVLVTSTEKIKRNFFNNFYMDVQRSFPNSKEEGFDNPEDEGKIIVKAVDSEEKRMFMKHVLTDVSVERTGRFAVTDVDLLISLLKKIPTSREIRFQDNNNLLEIKTTDAGTFYGFKMRQEAPNEDMTIALTESTHGVGEWDSLHSFENGIPKITMDGQSRLYNTTIKINKMELKKIIGISTDLTKDQDLKISVKENTMTFQSGKKKENIQSEINLTKDIENPIEIKEKIITNLHPIVDHLFEESTLFLRLAGDGALKFWLQSSKDNIELNYCSGSL